MIHDAYNPIPRSLLIGFLDKGKDSKKLAKILEEKQNKSPQEALAIGEKYYFMRTAGAITDLFVEEDILKDIDIFDNGKTNKLTVICRENDVAVYANNKLQMRATFSALQSGMIILPAHPAIKISNLNLIPLADYKQEKIQ